MLGSIGTTNFVRRLPTYLILLGLFLTIRGYRSREVDQAYRLPILLHQQDSRVFSNDPFVSSFDRFNPHRGYLGLLDFASRPAGLSIALVLLFSLTFLITVFAVDNLASAVWCDPTRPTGLIAAGLVLIAQAGNIGTNHLFEPMLLDRLIAFGLGWAAIGFGVTSRTYASALLISLATLIHPSVGLQLAMLLAVAWVAWWLWGQDQEGRVVPAILALALAVVPGLLLNLRNSGLLLEGLPSEDVRLLSAELQSPQHMLPHLWRFPQWLAWVCYPALALGSLLANEREPLSSPRRRLAILLLVNLVGLALAWVGIEWWQHLRLTLFQPFRMATVARGLCLVLLAGHVRRLLDRATLPTQLRAGLLVTGLVGDWMLVVATAFEIVMIASDHLEASRWHKWGQLAAFATLGAGLVFLSRHDTKSGHIPLLVVSVAVLCFGSRIAKRSWTGTGRRVAFRLAACWVIPLLAIVANVFPDSSFLPGVRKALIQHCRFAEIPIDDLERLAVWCRYNTPTDARFIGPPGPKTFRLWSLRPLAFNRAASPYHAEALADWADRFRDHLGFVGSNAEFVRTYQKDRHALERRYNDMSDIDKAALATRQGATFIVASSDASIDERGPLVRWHVEGEYAVYEVTQRRTTPELVVGTPQ